MASIDGLIETYETIRPQYEAFTESLQNLLRTLISTAGVEYFAVEPRTKSIESFSGKFRETKNWASMTK